MGIMLGHLNIIDYDWDVTFNEPLDVKYDEIYPRNTDNLHLKKIEINDIWVYWNSESAAYVSSTLFDDTWDSKIGIFDAIDAETLWQFMITPFESHATRFYWYDTRINL